MSAENLNNNSTLGAVHDTVEGKIINNQVSIHQLVEQSIHYFVSTIAL
jgi:hypothetical protein